jgi:hypothetical protein
VMNLSSKPAKFKYIEKDIERTYSEYFTGKEMKIKPQMSYSMQPWEYMVLIEK